MVRDRQRQRTRKDLLQAASRLMAAGKSPSLEEIAEEAMVSRATAYRYFPGLDALLNEAALDMAVPEVDTVLGPDAPIDIAARVERVDDALDAMIRANETALRRMLVHSLQQKANGEDVPIRQNRRLPLIEAALNPAGGGPVPGSHALLAKALALVIGTESMLVCKDVLRLDDEAARRVRHWAIRALVAAAQR